MSFNHALGMRREGDAIVLDATAAHEVAPGLVHFAVLTTLAEVAAAGTIDAGVVPAQVSVNLLSAARPGRLEARGTLVRQGRRLAVAMGEVTQVTPEGAKQVARATVTFAVVD